MGLMVIMDPADYFARGAGMPPDAQRALGSRGKLHHGWRSKTPTERMRDFHKKLLWAVPQSPDVTYNLYPRAGPAPG